NWFGVVDENQRSSLAFRLSHSGGSPAVSWILADDVSDFSWNPGSVTLAEPASDSEANPVTFGETASLPGLNVLIDSNSPGSYQLTLTTASPDPNGSLYVVTITSDSAPC